MTPPPLTLQLVSLRCLTAQENDGDEIYVQVDGRTLWSVGTLRMSDRLSDDQQTNDVDFLHGQFHTRNGWQAMQTFDGDDFRAPLSGDYAQVRLCERDLLLGDDLLGEAIITAADAERGKIQLAFTAEGAHYTLTYALTRSEANP
jgi:hypothetical protein